MRRVVLFPQPEGPSREKNSPPGTCRSMASTARTSANSFVSLVSSISPRAMVSEATSEPESCAEVFRRRPGLLLAAGEEAPGEEAERDDDQGGDHHDRCDRVHGGQRGCARRAVDPDRDGVRVFASREPLAVDDVMR